MKVKIEFEVGNAAFEDDFHGELLLVLRQATAKVVQQLYRTECSCTTPEAADILLDSNGNRIGTVALEKS